MDDLNWAIINYLERNGVNTSTIKQQLNLDQPKKEEITLEQKWTALSRLQRRVIDLEQQNHKLTIELQHASQNQNASPGLNLPSLANWIPKWPPKHTLINHRGRVNCVKFHPSWSILVSGDDQSEIKVWDLESGDVERTLKSHTRSVTCIDFSPVSHQLITCSADLSIKVFNPKQEFANIKTLNGHEHTVSAVASFNKDKQEYIVSASRDKTIRIWDLSSGFPIQTLSVHSDWVRCLSVNNNVLVSGSSDRNVILHELSGDEGLVGNHFIYKGHQHVIECCEIAPKDSTQFLKRHVVDINVNCKEEVYFASAGRDLTILIWSSQSSSPILKLVGHENWIQSVKFHPNGRFLLSVGDDKTMRLWDLVSGKSLRTINAHDHFITCMDWRGRNLATGSVDSSVRVW